MRPLKQEDPVQNEEQYATGGITQQALDALGWHPEPGYKPDWQKKVLVDLCGPMGRVQS